jgi:ketosteroid isomerase-like protein
MNTREVVTKCFEFMNAGRWEEYLNLFADDLVMDEQLLGHSEGKAHLAQSVESLRKAAKLQNQPLEIVVEGARAMAVWHMEATLAPGVNLSVKGANYYRIVNGKIVYFSNYHDTAPFAPILGK